MNYMAFLIFTFCIAFTQGCKPAPSLKMENKITFLATRLGVQKLGLLSSSSSSSSSSPVLEEKSPVLEEVLEEKELETVTAQNYHKLFKENEVAHQEKFLDKEFLMTGTIASVKVVNGDPMVRLNGGNSFQYVEIYMSPETNFAELRFNQKVLMWCIGGEKRFIYPTAHCFIKKNKVP